MTIKKYAKQQHRSVNGENDVNGQMVKLDICMQKKTRNFSKWNSLETKRWTVKCFPYPQVKGYCIIMCYCVQIHRCNCKNGLFSHQANYSFIALRSDVWRFSTYSPINECACCWYSPLWILTSFLPLFSLTFSLN